MAGIICRYLFFVLQMNIYLLHTFGCGFKNTQKLSALPFEQTGFFFHRCTHCKMCPKRNMRKILIYILLLCLKSFSFFHSVFSHFFTQTNGTYFFHQKKIFVCSLNISYVLFFETAMYHIEIL